MKILLEYCQGCKKHINQDAYGYKDNFFWVIDGATDVFDNHYLSPLGDVYWIVQKLNNALKKGNTKSSLKEFVSAAIREVQLEALAKVPNINQIAINKLPTYAICCVKYTQGFLEYLCLGDCSLFISKSPTTRYTDTRIQPFHLQVNEVKEQYKNNSEQYRAHVLEIVREIKNFINIENGYWIGILDPNIVEHAIIGNVEIEEKDRFVICSDGFRPSIDEANLIYFESKDIFIRAKLQTILEQQNLEENNYLLKTGIDISDDKTVLLVEI
ncbi:MAG: protein phosphatase 2C domain-containing protein [Lachnospiraceae bacterium]|nr:protein phosphatase 2C domain-containing protein [Lachnospiraceae bacterium]